MTRLRKTIWSTTVLVGLLCGCGPDEPPDDKPEPELTVAQQIERGIDEQGIEPLAEPEPQEPAKVKLGRALFFDKILSGTLDTSCASCHHPREMTADDLPLSAGVGAEVDGTVRTLGDGRTWTARNSPDIFNRGISAWTTQFWDMRIRQSDQGDLLTPAGSRLPEGLDNLLAVQAMFPVTERDEMRGERWDKDIHGEPNVLGEIVDGLVNKMWAKLMARLMANEEYRQMFAAAYPGVPLDEMGFEYAANAIAAFEIEAFALTDSPWDRYVAGDEAALDEAQRRGAAVFFGKGKCAECHSGTLFTDQKPHNLAVPQCGPGRSPDEPYDLGYGRVSNDPDYNFAFRTPSLRNVAITPPYMHNGAYDSLEGAVRHHMRPAQSLREYDGSHLEPKMRQMLHNDPEVQARVLETLDPKMEDPPQLTDQEIDDVVAFMEALTSERTGELVDVVPEAVPSGLPLD